MKMNEEICKRYLNKKVHVVLRNGFHFKGLVLEVTPLALNLKDKKIGESWFALETIIQIYAEDWNE